MQQSDMASKLSSSLTSFLDESDMNNKYNLALERMKKIDYKKKIYHLQNMLEHIVSSGYKGVKLLEIAKHYGVNDN